MILLQGKKYIKNREITPLCKEKRSDTFGIKPMLFNGGDEEIRTLVPVSRQPHFECGSL